MLNSGRLTSISATVSPWPMPSAARPPAIRRTRLAYSAYVIVIASPGVRSAIWSGRSAAVSWNASHSVVVARAAGAVAGTVVVANASLLVFGTVASGGPLADDRDPLI